MTRYYVLFFFMVISVPLLLGLNAWQANECGKIRNEIITIQESQKNCINENNAIVNEIVQLQSTERLEAEAKKMGLRKMRPEDVILVIMGGKGRGH